MESIYYWNLEYLDMQYFPVLPENYELTTDRPGCEKSADDRHYETQVIHFPSLACELILSSLIQRMCL